MTAPIDILRTIHRLAGSSSRAPLEALVEALGIEMSKVVEMLEPLYDAGYVATADGSATLTATGMEVVTNVASPDGGTARRDGRCRYFLCAVAPSGDQVIELPGPGLRAALEAAPHLARARGWTAFEVRNAGGFIEFAEPASAPDRRSLDEAIRGAIWALHNIVEGLVEKAGDSPDLCGQLDDVKRAIQLFPEYRDRYRDAEAGSD
jgi:hypothetical protein